MKKLNISEADLMVLALQDEIRRTDEARYDHRLHAVLLVAQGMSCREASDLLGDSIRTIQYWVRRFQRKGLSGLVDAPRPGRPSRLSPEQLARIAEVLRESPNQVGLSANLWDGKTLSAFLLKAWGISLGVRQCQRLFRQRNFRFRKPRPVIAHADPEEQQNFKKNSSAPPGPRDRLMGD
jgi:transposase